MVAMVQSEGIVLMIFRNAIEKRCHRTATIGRAKTVGKARQLCLRRLSSGRRMVRMGLIL